MRSEYDLVEERPKIVLHISKSKYLPKQPIKRARMSGSLGKICYHCEETVSNMDIKMKNGLVNCADHRVHKYCQEHCLLDH